MGKKRSGKGDKNKSSVKTNETVPKEANSNTTYHSSPDMGITLYLLFTYIIISFCLKVTKCSCVPIFSVSFIWQIDV